MRAAVVVGNPNHGSRTLSAAIAVADLVDREVAMSERLVVDLATLGARVLDWGATEVSDLNAAVAASQLLIVASPTYKASYTGLLKVFLDRYGNDGLAGTVAVPFMTGAAPIHALAPEAHLRPLLVELGASLPTRSIFLTEASLADVQSAIEPWAQTAVPLLRQALGPRNPPTTTTDHLNQGDQT